MLRSDTKRPRLAQPRIGNRPRKPHEAAWITREQSWWVEWRGHRDGAPATTEEWSGTQRNVRGRDDTRRRSVRCNEWVGHRGRHRSAAARLVTASPRDGRRAGLYAWPATTRGTPSVPTRPGPSRPPRARRPAADVRRRRDPARLGSCQPAPGAHPEREGADRRVSRGCSRDEGCPWRQATSMRCQERCASCATTRSRAAGRAARRRLSRTPSAAPAASAPPARPRCRPGNSSPHGPGIPPVAAAGRSGPRA